MATSKKQTHPQKKPSASQSQSIASKPERQVQKEMAAYRQELARNPKAAHDFLVSTGIITAKGNLRKVFGG